MDDFKALAAQLATDAKAAATAAPNGVDAFKTAFFTVNGDCSACHKKYRTE
jgi:cytochrome c556